ncbi:MAG: diadenylate cyclase CdaA [Prevotellaceae bacterium]|jgi:uncharacterized protein (TIGR00159 family)|nr:diadenylate cyclase CdaA [Prevotellaceae bacterium]
MFDFIHISLSDVLDIAFVALLGYQIYKLIRGTNAVNIITIVLLLYFLWYVVQALHMDVSSAILGQILGVGILALIILFQQEIRRYLLYLGTRFNMQRYAWLQRIFNQHTTAAVTLDLDALTMACRNMSETKTGALIVVGRKSEMGMYAGTGDVIDAKMNNRLLENIFFKNSPLHDGAVIIVNNKIHAARCTLPITDRQMPAHYGLRHRAAVGLTENTDAIVVVVSEETGRIALVCDGEISRISGANELRVKVENLLNYERQSMN